MNGNSHSTISFWFHFYYLQEKVHYINMLMMIKDIKLRSCIFTIALLLLGTLSSYTITAITTHSIDLNYSFINSVLIYCYYYFNTHICLIITLLISCYIHFISSMLSNWDFWIISFPFLFPLVLWIVFVVSPIYCKNYSHIAAY